MRSSTIEYFFLSSILLSVMSLVGCVSSSSQEAKPQPATNNNQFVAPASTTVTACAATAMPMNATVSDSVMRTRILNGNEMSLFNETETFRSTLCDTLRGSGRTVAIFQFAGVMCIDCQQESVEIERRIATSAAGSRMVHVLVFTDSKETRTPNYASQISTFMKNYASRGIYRFDDRQQLWSFISPSKEWGSAIMMNLSGKIEAVGQAKQLENVWSAAERMALP